MSEHHHPDIKLFQSLVKRTSVSGTEALIQQDILEYFQNLGLSNEDAFMQAGKNVVVHLHGKRHDKAMMFIPHVDTVDLEDNAKWRHGSATSGVIERKNDEDRLYGRGACDTKAGVFAAMEVAKELYERQKQGEDLPYDSFFVFPVGEETDNNGTRDFGKWFQEEYGTRYNELSAIFLEPTNLEIKFGHRGNLIFHTKASSDSKTGIERSLEFLKQTYEQSKTWAIEQHDHPFGATLVNATNINSTGSKGEKYQPKGKIVRIVSQGEQIHVSLTENVAISKLSVKKLIGFISEMDSDIKLVAIRTEKTVTNKTPSKIELDIEIPEGEDGELLAQLNALSQKHDVLVVPNIGPDDYIPYSDTVDSDIDVRTIPDHHEEAREKVTTIARTLGITYQEQPDTPYGKTNPEASIIKAYMNAVAGIIKPITPGIFTAASDMGVLQSLGGIFEKLQAVIFGAGDLNMAHKIDEFVPLNQVYNSINILLKWYFAWI